MDTRQSATIEKPTNDSKVARFMISISKADAEALQAPTETRSEFKNCSHDAGRHARGHPREERAGEGGLFKSESPLPNPAHESEFEERLFFLSLPVRHERGESRREGLSKKEIPPLPSPLLPPASGREGETADFQAFVHYQHIPVLGVGGGVSRENLSASLLRQLLP